jgi:hypothetical protein
LFLLLQVGNASGADLDALAAASAARMAAGQRRRSPEEQFAATQAGSSRGTAATLWAAVVGAVRRLLAQRR